MNRRTKGVYRPAEQFAQVAQQSPHALAVRKPMDGYDDVSSLCALMSFRT